MVIKNVENATSAIVAAPEGANRTILAGQVIPPPVGRAQDMYLYDKKDALYAWLAFTFVLNSTDHQGTITLNGADPILVKARDISLYQLLVVLEIDFAMARGIATLMTDAFEAEVYFRLHVDTKLFQCW
ncbi:hypothetical protein AQUCO_02100205v1 [Aquilegia coerulea]|uniref:Dirigent protein n=1 Tax=Aquilegia coerulea TaxID=218851 RepID=A0A2G5DG25_AQUCA|nr:hypothetical protein AQUCO_02100205v1 [Aquilegia coerulea]